MPETTEFTGKTACIIGPKTYPKSVTTVGKYGTTVGKYEMMVGKSEMTVGKSGALVRLGS